MVREVPVEVVREMEVERIVYQDREVIVEKIVEKIVEVVKEVEVVREVVKEVYVDRIVEVEKIVQVVKEVEVVREVPVDRIVERIVYLDAPPVAREAFVATAQPVIAEPVIVARVEDVFPAPASITLSSREVEALAGRAAAEEEEEEEEKRVAEEARLVVEEARAAERELELELAAQAKAREIEMEASGRRAPKKLADADDTDDIAVGALHSSSGIHPWEGADADSHLIADAVPVRVLTSAEAAAAVKRQATAGRGGSSNRGGTLSGRQSAAAGASSSSFSVPLATSDTIDDLIKDALCPDALRPPAAGVFRSKFGYGRATSAGSLRAELPTVPAVVMGVVPGRGGSARPASAAARPAIHRPLR